MEFSKIRDEIKKRNLVFEDFARSINITPQGLYKALNRKSLKVTDLEKISEGLGVTAAFWWGDNEELKAEKKRCDYLEKSNMNLLDQVEELKAKLNEREGKSKRAS